VSELRTSDGFWTALRTPIWVSRIVLFVALVCIVTPFAPDFASRTRLVAEMVPDVFPAAAATGSAAIGVILLLLSRQLRRGKFRAWLVALVLTSLAAALHVLRGLDVEEAVLCLALAGLLATSRRNFTARPDPRSTSRLLFVLVVGPVVAGLLGFAWLSWSTKGQVPGTTAWDRLQHAFLGLIGVPGPIDFTTGAALNRSAVALVVLGAGVLLLAILVAMEPAGGPHFITPEEEARVRRLIEEWGWVDSLAYFATREDRALLFGPDGQAAISYRVVGTVSFAAGDPIGNPASWPGAIQAWLAEARSFGWTPANLGASERGARAFHRAGLEVLEVGDEAVVHASDFTLEGRSMRSVRQAVARASRAGVTASCHRVRDLDLETRKLLRHKAVEWRIGPTERGFAMALGRFGQRRDDNGAVVVARGPDGAPLGLLSFAPWGDDALSLDLMRRSPEAENGIVELMVTTLMADAERLGISKISLNFAAFRSTFARGERLGAGFLLRGWRAILLAASRFVQIESLYRANSKFQPEWVPRFLVYPGVTDIPKVATAALRAEALVVAPEWYQRLTGRGGNPVEEIPEITPPPAAPITENETARVETGQPQAPAQ
jgi:lysyl-tRNA synthetase class 2